MRSLCLSASVDTEAERYLKVGLLLGAKIIFVVVTVLSCVSLSAFVQHCPEEPSAVLPDVNLVCFFHLQFAT